MEKNGEFEPEVVVFHNRRPKKNPKESSSTHKARRESTSGQKVRTQFDKNCSVWRCFFFRLASI
jgi:hypothetical protein